MESPSELGTSPHTDFFPLTLSRVSCLQWEDDDDVKLWDALSKFSVNVTRFWEKPNGSISSMVVSNRRNFLILNNLINK